MQHDDVIEALNPTMCDVTGQERRDSLVRHHHHEGVSAREDAKMELKNVYYSFCNFYSQQEIAPLCTGYGHSAIPVGQNDRQTNLHTQGQSQLRALLSRIFSAG